MSGVTLLVCLPLGAWGLAKLAGQSGDLRPGDSLLLAVLLGLLINCEILLLCSIWVPITPFTAGLLTAGPALAFGLLSPNVRVKLRELQEICSRKWMHFSI